MRHRARLGFVLPLAMIAMLVALVVVGSMHLAAWRALRGARLQWDAQHALYASNAAVVETVAQWDALAAAQRPVGVTWWTSVTANGWRTETGVARTAPLVAVVTAHTVWGPDPLRVHRRVTRIVQLDAPLRPHATLTVLGRLQDLGAAIDGRDQVTPVDPLRDDCGPFRDTTSVPAVDSVPVGLRNVARLAFDRAWSDLTRRTPARTLEHDGSIRQSAAWIPVRIVGDSSGVTLDGQSVVRGLVVVDGDLTVRGTLRLDGLLVVRGALRADGGDVQIDGAAIVRDARAAGSTVGPRTRVRWAPCLADRALAAVAPPKRAPFHQWNSP